MHTIDPKIVQERLQGSEAADLSKGVCSVCSNRGWIVVLMDHRIEQEQVQRCDSCFLLPDDYVAQTMAKDAGIKLDEEGNLLHEIGYTYEVTLKFIVGAIFEPDKMTRQNVAELVEDCIRSGNGHIDANNVRDWELIDVGNL